MGAVADDDGCRAPLHPFTLEIDLVARMLNVEITGDPHYSGLEIQGLDDAAHGRGTVVLLTRTGDSRTDVYYERGLRLDKAGYAIAGGLGEWVETEFENAILDVGAEGVRASVRFADAAGRLVEVEVSDRTPRGRRASAFLAPMGAAITEPRSLPLVWMPQFDLLHRSGPAPTIRIDGRAARVGRLPAERLLRRRLIKVASDLCVVAVNAGEVGPVRLGSRGTGARTVGGARGTEAIVRTAGGHEARLELDPPFPALGTPVGACDGAWSVVIDDAPVVAGSWRVRPADGEVHVELDVTQGWRPEGLPLLMSIVTRVAPVFRTWPTTYRWTATLVDGDDEPTVTSRWTRTKGDRGESYRALTRSG